MKHAKSQNFNGYVSPLGLALNYAGAQDKDPAALSRFAALPAFADMTSAELGSTDLALHDAQSVIAREHGFVSWNALREEVESRTLSFEAAVDEFIRCATGGATGRAERADATCCRP